MATRKSHLKVVNEANSIDIIIANMKRSFLECRDWGHTWRPYDARIDNKGKFYIEILRCTRCVSRRERKIAYPSGGILKTTYTYPEGYLVPGWGGMTKNDKGILRIAVLQMMIESHGIAAEVEVG